MGECKTTPVNKPPKGGFKVCDNSKDIEEAIKKLGDVSHLVSEGFKVWLDQAYESLTRFWESYYKTEHYKKQVKYKKRVSNREKLYKKRMAKYGRY